MANTSYRLTKVCGEHARAVSSVKFSPNGEHLASASADATVKIWDVSGNLRATLEGHSQGISDVSWAANSTTLVTASDDKTLRVWDLNTGTSIRTLDGHENYVCCVNFNKQRSDMLVSGSFDEAIRLWDARQYRCLKIMTAHADPVTATDFNNDGTCVVSSSYDGLIRIWDSSSGSSLTTIFATSNPPVSFVKYSPNGKYVLAGTLDSNVRLWNASSQQQSKCVKYYRGHQNVKYSIFSTFLVAHPSDSKYVVSGSEDNCVYIWNLQTRELAQKLEGHTDIVLAVSEHPSRQMLASGGMTRDRTVRLWEDETGPNGRRRLNNKQNNEQNNEKQEQQEQQEEQQEEREKDGAGAERAENGEPALAGGGAVVSRAMPAQ